MATISEALTIALQYHQGGRFQAAEQIYRQVLAAAPNQADAIHLLGVLAHQMGKHEVAVEYIQRAVQLRGDACAFHNNLGEAYRALHRIAEAVASYRHALELNPDYAEAHNNLGNALRELGKLNEAVACFQRTLELKPNFSEVHFNLGVAFQQQRELDKAVACYRRALELKPDFAEALGDLGCALEQMGDLRRSEEAFRAALRHNSRFTLAHYKLAEILGGRLADEDLAAQRRLLAERDLTGVQQLWLHFALARVLDARGEFAEAAEHAAQGNALQLAERRAQGHEYDAKGHEALVARTIETCNLDFFDQVRGFGLESEVPVFIVGLPRSGTSLVEQILASHSQVFGAGELQLASGTMAELGKRGANPTEGLRRLDRHTAHRLAGPHLQKLRAFNPVALRIVDKMPENYLHLGLLACLFPRAKFVHCRRDLRDVAVSCWLTPFREVPWSNDQEHIVSRFHAYQRIMEHWRRILPAPLLEVGYEETVADLEDVARRLVAWCRLAWEPKCLEFHRAKRPVSTASAVQVRQPVFKTSAGRWKHYEQALGPLFARLGTTP